MSFVENLLIPGYKGYRRQSLEAKDSLVLSNCVIKQTLTNRLKTTLIFYQSRIKLYLRINPPP